MKFKPKIVPHDFVGKKKAGIIAIFKKKKYQASVIQYVKKMVICNILIIQLTIS